MKQDEVEWRRLLSEQAASGKSALSFCRERGIKDSQFFYWRKRLKPPEPAGQFVSVGVAKPVELELKSGIKVRCGVESLKAVVDVLSS